MHSLDFFIVTKRIWLAPFLQVKISVLNSGGGSFCWNCAFDTIAIMKVTSVAIIQVLRFYCNYSGGAFCYSYAGGYFCCNHAGDCFSCNCAVRRYAGDNYAGDNFYCNYAGWGLCCKLCRWYFLQCIMHITVSIVIMQVTVSVIAMQETVSSNNFIFFSLAPTFQKIDQKTFKSIISDLHFTTVVNILPKLRYFEDRNYIKIS